MATVVGGPAATCASCGEELGGPYCARCGERVLDAESRTIRHFLMRTVPQELFDVDGKLWRTFRALLFRPGFVSREYSAGRRTLYLSPLRLLLTSIVLYALATQGGLLITLTMGRVSLSIAPTTAPFRMPGLPNLINGVLSIILSGILILLRTPNYPASPSLSVRCGAQLAQTVETLG